MGAGFQSDGPEANTLPASTAAPLVGAVVSIVRPTANPNDIQVVVLEGPWETRYPRLLAFVHDCVCEPRRGEGDFEQSALPTENSAAVVTRAREIQLTRQGKCNARLTDAQIDRICSPDNAGRALLDRAMKTFGFSARARQRILKLARTIADLSNEATVGASHVGEAVTYRSFDRRPPPS
jgi:hypothetical protein